MSADPAFPLPMLAAIGTIGIIVSLALTALSLAASYYLYRKIDNKSIAQDDKPTTLATRGAFIPYVLGRRRVGAIVCWAGNRFTRKESVGSGGKGSSKKKQKQVIYFESAMHVLCVGPAFKLHRIWLDGTPIFSRTIDAQSHPSGSTIDLGNEGSFQIYWGHYNQPVSTYLSDASRIGIASRWPLVCYIVWRDKRLGIQSRWPLIDYEVETRIQDSAALSVAGAPWFEPTKTLAGSALTITAVTNGVPGTNKVRVAGNQIDLFKPGGFGKIAGNAASANGDYRIHKAEYIPPPAEFGGSDFTDVYFDFSLTGATVSGTLQAYSLSDDDGINPAHAVAHLLFAKFPGGLDLDPADFDLTTLDDLAQVCETEKLPISLVGQSGPPVTDLLANLMQDIGFVIGWDVARGKYVFRAIRQETSPVTVDGDIVMEPNPEIQVVLGEHSVDKMVFTFSDRARNFRDMTLTVDDDAQGSLLKHQRTRKVDLPTVISAAVASKIVERRIQEDMSGASAIKFVMNRASRLFVPGHVFTVPGYPGSYRALKTSIEPLNGKVTVDAITDIFGSKTSTYVATAPPAPAASLEPKVDLAMTFIEVPSHVSPGVQNIIVPRIRAHNQIVGADIHLSRDGVTYTHWNEDTTVYTGGTLDAEFASGAYSNFFEIDQGPTITALGPDIGTVLDLSGDTASWRAGRQLVLIDEELFYLKKVTALGGNQYRLDGLIRARFDTPKATHASGAKVYIFQDDATQIDDLLLVPNVTLYVKAQPKTTVSLPLSQTPAVSKTLVGKGVTPMRMEAHRTANFSQSYRTGESITAKWAYRQKVTPRTGAGFQGAGTATGVGAVEGSFQVRIKDVSNVVKRETSVTTAEYTYSNANLVQDFGSEPASFKVEVTNVSGGLKSPVTEITVTKVT